jgi:hypothetical protein
MRARIAYLATPRRIVATECCVAALAAGIALLIAGPTPLAFALLAACAATTVPALLALGRLEKRGSRD